MKKAELKKLQEKIEEAKSDLETGRDADQEAFDDKSDNWKEGDAGQAAEARIEALTAAVDALEGAVSSINEAMGD